MIFAHLFHEDSDKIIKIWEILEGTGNPAEIHKIIGVIKTAKGQITRISHEHGLDLSADKIEQWIED